MDPRKSANVIGVELSQLDLSELDVGQSVEIITDKGTFWVTRTDMSGFNGSDHGAVRMAVAGTDYTPTSPFTTQTTRQLKPGECFTAVNGNNTAQFGTIQHIVIPAVPVG